MNTINTAGLWNEKVVDISNMNVLPTTHEGAIQQAVRRNNGKHPGYTLHSANCPQCGERMAATQHGKVYHLYCANHTGTYEGYETLGGKFNGDPTVQRTATYHLFYTYRPHSGVLELEFAGDYAGAYPMTDSHSLIDIIE